MTAMAWSKQKALEYGREWRRAHAIALNETRRAQYAKNREREQNRLRHWRHAHPELVAEQRKRAYAARRAKYPERRELIQAAIKKRRAANSERYRQYDRNSYRRHRQKAMQRAAKYGAKRRAQKKDASIGDTSVIAQWQQAIRNMKWVRCHWCGTKVPGRDVHFDHVVALSNGGSHSLGNICASCPECNRSKNARVIANWVVGGQSFLNL